MRRTILDDRLLARMAYQAAGREQTASLPVEAADIAFGQAVVALRVHGAVVGSEALRVLRADIDAIFADSVELARARRIAKPASTPAPSRTILPAPLLAVAR